MNTCCLLNSQNPLLSDWQPFDAESQWIHLDKEYNFFRDIQDLRVIKLTFSKLAQSARKIIIFDEQNNDKNNNLCYIYAYKLLALYLTSEQASTNTPQKTCAIAPLDADACFNHIAKAVHKLISQSDKTFVVPYHDVLLVRLKLPKKTQLQHYHDYWQKMVLQYGIPVFYAFSIAENIEKKWIESGDAVLPTSLKTLNHFASRCAYQRADEDADFAAICLEQKVTEPNFNLILNYLQQAPGWPKKTVDTLPDVCVELDDGEHLYYWLKLPLNDKRALIMGYFTDCCQSYGDYAMHCVVDAVTLPNNGIYVLLKRKRYDPNKIISPCIDGKINYQDYTVIAQSYVWKSIAHHLCLDSFELLKDSISIDNIRAILSQFAEMVFLKEEYIQFTNVGTGGKTPKNLFPLAPIPEKIDNAYSYGDSDTQYCIASRNPLLDFTTNETMTPYEARVLQYLSAHFPQTATLKEEMVQRNLLSRGGLHAERIMLYLHYSFAPRTLHDLEYFDFTVLEEGKNNPHILQTLTVPQIIFNIRNAADLILFLECMPDESLQRGFLSTLEECHPKLMHKVFAIAGTKLPCMQAIASSAPNLPFVLIEIFKQATGNERMALISYYKNQLIDTIKTMDDLENFFNTLTEDERAILNDGFGDQFLKLPIDDKELWIKGLNYWPREHLKAYFSAHFKLLEKFFVDHKTCEFIERTFRVKKDLQFQAVILEAAKPLIISHLSKYGMQYVLSTIFSLSITNADAYIKFIQNDLLLALSQPSQHLATELNCHSGYEAEKKAQILSLLLESMTPEMLRIFILPWIDNQNLWHGFKTIHVEIIFSKIRNSIIEQIADPSSYSAILRILNETLKTHIFNQTFQKIVDRCHSMYDLYELLKVFKHYLNLMVQGKKNPPYFADFKFTRDDEARKKTLLDTYKTSCITSKEYSRSLLRDLESKDRDLYLRDIAQQAELYFNGKSKSLDFIGLLQDVSEEEQIKFLEEILTRESLFKIIHDISALTNLLEVIKSKVFQQKLFKTIHHQCIQLFNHSNIVAKFISNLESEKRLMIVKALPGHFAKFVNGFFDLYLISNYLDETQLTQALIELEPHFERFTEHKENIVAGVSRVLGKATTQQCIYLLSKLRPYWKIIIKSGSDLNYLIRCNEKYNLMIFNEIEEVIDDILISAKDAHDALEKVPPLIQEKILNKVSKKYTDLTNTVDDFVYIVKALSGQDKHFYIDHEIMRLAPYIHKISDANKIIENLPEAYRTQFYITHQAQISALLPKSDASELSNLYYYLPSEQQETFLSLVFENIDVLFEHNTGTSLLSIAKIEKRAPLYDVLKLHLIAEIREVKFRRFEGYLDYIPPERQLDFLYLLMDDLDLIVQQRHYHKNFLNKKPYLSYLLYLRKTHGLLFTEEEFPEIFEICRSNAIVDKTASSYRQLFEILQEHMPTSFIYQQMFLKNEISAGVSSHRFFRAEVTRSTEASYHQEIDSCRFLR